MFKNFFRVEFYFTQWDILEAAIGGGWGDAAQFSAEEQFDQMSDMLVDMFTMSMHRHSVNSYPQAHFITVKLKFECCIEVI